MGVLTRGILGGFRGSVGPVTGTSWKGIDVIKSKPLSVANPRTAAQTNQRNKFAGVVAFAVALLANIVKPLWDRFAQKESGYNAFVQTNIANFNDNGELNDPSTLKISNGTWPNIADLSSVALNSNGLLFFNAVGGGGLATDEVYAAVFVQTGGQILGQKSSGNRASGDHTIDFAKQLTVGDPYSLYIATRRADGTAVSSTLWYQDTVITA